MRVAVVTNYFPTSQQQWAGHTAYQTLRLLAQRCELHVFYPEPAYPAFLTPHSSRQPALDRSWSPEGVQTTYIPFPVLPLLSRPFNGKMIARRLLSTVRRFQPDVILSYFLYPDGYAAVRIAEALGVPAVVTGIGSDINRIPNWLVRRMTVFTLRHAAYVNTVSHDLCRKARRLGADPARSGAQLNGCDTALFHPQDRVEARRQLGVDPDAKVAVYVGRLDLRKGLIELVEAAAQLAVQAPSLRCYIVGDGPDKPALMEAITKQNVAAHVTLVPSCPTERVALWMTAADIVTLPSYAEGCPNVIVEALAAGRPVIATNVGGIPELVDDSCGRLVPPRKVPQLAGALADALNQSWDADAISARHSRSWQDVSNEMYAVLQGVLSPRS